MVDQLFPDGHWKPPSVPLIVLHTLLTTFATICVSLRMYARISLKRRIAADDILILLGLVLTISRTVMACFTTQIGYASRVRPDAPYQIPWYIRYFIRRVLYVLSAFFTRAGVLTYYLRLFPHALGKLRTCSWILLAICTVHALHLIITLSIYCDDIGDLYRGDLAHYSNKHCSDAISFTYASVIGDAAIDFMIYFLPVPYVWGLRRLRLDQRISLVCVFGIGMVACVFAVSQIPFVVKDFQTGPYGQKWFGWVVPLFSGVELSLGLVAASLPDLRGLIARKKPGLLTSFRHRLDSQRTPLGDESMSMRRSWPVGLPACPHRSENSIKLKTPAECNDCHKHSRPVILRRHKSSFWEMRLGCQPMTNPIAEVMPTQDVASDGQLGRRPCQLPEASPTASIRSHEGEDCDMKGAESRTSI